MLGCSFALDKTCIVASSKLAGEQVSSQLAELSTSPSAPAVNLGVDFTAGRALRVGGRCAKLKSRFAAAGRRSKRLRRHNKVLKRAAIIKVRSAGPLAGASYGSEITGTSDQDLLSLRRSLFSTVRPLSKFRSLTTSVGYSRLGSLLADGGLSHHSVVQGSVARPDGRLLLVDWAARASACLVDGFQQGGLFLAQCRWAALCASHVFIEDRVGDDGFLNDQG